MTPGPCSNWPERYRDHFAGATEQSFPDAAFTANCGRQHFPHRLAFVANSAREAQEQLDHFCRGDRPATIYQAEAGHTPPPVAFLFSGQGAQFVGMARQLDHSQPEFRRTLDECEELLRPSLERPLREVLYGENADESELARTAYAQPALFAVEYALAELWRQWGVEPFALLGHSIGEYVAACLAGVFDLPAALKLVAARGRLMDRLPKGGTMAAVSADGQVVQSAIAAWGGQKVAIAAYNAPRQVVISGESSAVEAVVSQLASQGVQSRRLAVSHAFHSPRMEPMLEEYAAVLREVSLSPPRRRVISNVTGGVAGEELATVDYWCRHIRQPVQLAAGMETLSALGCQVFLEVGPKTTLLGLGQQCLGSGEDKLWVGGLRPEREDWELVAESLAAMYVRGVGVDWLAWDRPYGRRKVILPSYPFQRQRYWVEGAGSAGAKGRSRGVEGRGIRCWDNGWRRRGRR